MNYLIAVFPDRISVEAAYTALEKANLPQAQLSIIGKGYKSADEFGFINPNQAAIKRIRLMAIWLIPFGFAAGYTFDSITNYHVFESLNDIASHVLGGFFGAIAGGMGSVFVGGGVGLTSGSGDAMVYRNRLNAGKYLLVVTGSEQLRLKATDLLRSFRPENIQGYVYAE